METNGDVAFALGEVQLDIYVARAEVRPGVVMNLFGKIVSIRSLGD
jgi:hypothetical protein